jgi:hypothetical protein
VGLDAGSERINIGGASSQTTIWAKSEVVQIDWLVFCGYIANFGTKSALCSTISNFSKTCLPIQRIGDHYWESDFTDGRFTCEI